jgi:hypothetical protein
MYSDPTAIEIRRANANSNTGGDVKVQCELPIPFEALGFWRCVLGWHRYLLLGTCSLRWFPFYRPLLFESNGRTA